MTDETDWSAGTWEGARRDMVRRNLNLSVRERLMMIDDLRETGERLASMRVRYGTDPGDEIALGGCQPTPLASYLKALGILRLIGEQVDGEVRGWWDDEGFRLATSLDRDQVVEFFARQYRPTPILAPWNGGSGFFPKDNQSGIRAVESSSAERFTSIRTTISRIREILDRMGLSGGMRSELKPDLLLQLRAELDDEALSWFDSAILLTEDAPRYPPLLGTGGNDGRLDFTNNFLQWLAALFDPMTGEPAAEATGLLRGSLFGDPVPGLRDGAIGQYSPASAGGANASVGFGGGTLMNPWDFIFMLEGAVLFAAAASRRLESARKGMLSYPFTVRPSGVGSGSTSLADERGSRGEVWMPLWERPVSLPEIRVLLGEGRAVVGNRPARDGLDFARAVAKLGVDRGISEFVRYGFLMRNGKAYFAAPLTRIRVRENPSARLIDELDHSGWLSRFRSLASPGGNAPARLVSLGYQLQDGLFRIAKGEGGSRATARRVQEVLVTLGAIQRYLTSSPKSRESLPPVPLLRQRWVETAYDGSVEFQIAAALAGLHSVRRLTTVETGGGKAEEVIVNRGMRMAAHFAPVTEDFRDTGWWEESREVVQTSGKLDRALFAILERRLTRVGVLGEWGKPLAATFSAPLSAVESWMASGSRMDRRISELLSGLVLTRIPASLPTRDRGRSRSAHPLPAAYHVLKPLFTDEFQLRRITALPATDSATAPLLPLILSLVRQIARTDADEGAEIVEYALRRLRIAGVAIPDETGSRARSLALSNVRALGLPGSRLLLALMVPIRDADLSRIVTHISAPVGKASAEARS